MGVERKIRKLPKLAGSCPVPFLSDHTMQGNRSESESLFELLPPTCLDRVEGEVYDIGDLPRWSPIKLNLAVFAEIGRFWKTSVFMQKTAGIPSLTDSPT